MTRALEGKICLVTGASGGIGAALVEKLCGAGAIVHAIARGSARLHALAEKSGCVPHAADVTDIDAIAAILSRLEPEIIVCNAGKNFAGSLAGADPSAVVSTVELNISAVLHLLRLALPGLMARNKGHIVLVGSIAGHHALTGGNAVYHATKAAIKSLAEQLRIDLAGHRIRLTEIAPGRTETEIFGKAIGDQGAARRMFFDGYEPLQPGDVADAILYALSVPAHVNIGHIEMTPTLQIIGGLTTVRSKDAKGSKTQEKARRD